MYRVFQALDELNAMIEDARSLPMTANCVVPRHESLLLLDDIRDSFPGELDDAQDVLFPDGHRLVGLDEAFRRSLAARTTGPEGADPMGPLPQDPAWASGGDDRPAVVKVVDAVKDVLTD